MLEGFRSSWRVWILRQIRKKKLDLIFGDMDKNNTFI